MKPTLALAFVSSALLLASCGGGPAPEPQPTEQAGQVLGTLRPFTPGSASSIKPEELNVSSGLDSAGKFGFTLPDAATMTTTYGGDLFPVYDAQQEVGVFGVCSKDSVKTDAPADLRLYPLNKLVTNTGTQVFANLTPDSKETLPVKFKAWWFSNQDATFSFSGDCILWGKVNTTLSLKRGWNVLDITVTGQSATLTVGTQPDASQVWTPYTDSNLGNLSAADLSLLLEPWKVAGRLRR